jgi:hypothetical protein
MSASSAKQTPNFKQKENSQGNSLRPSKKESDKSDMKIKEAFVLCSICQTNGDEIMTKTNHFYHVFKEIFIYHTAQLLVGS